MYFVFIYFKKVDKVFVLGYSEFKVLYNRQMGNYVDVLVIFGLGRREMQKIKYLNLLYFIEKIKELGFG